MAPRKLAFPLQSLPPILHMMNQSPISGCSKGSRGLSVLLQVARIFTGIAISPSPSLRQRPSRYAIRAGRNLPDKEFRYLRLSCYSQPSGWWPGHFCLALHVAMEVGLYLHSAFLAHFIQLGIFFDCSLSLSAWRIVSEDSRTYSSGPFLLIVRTPRIFTASPRRRRVPGDTRSFQHIAKFYNGPWTFTVIVTAAVHRGLGSKLRSPAETGS